MESAEDATMTPDQELKIALDLLDDARWRLFRAGYKLGEPTTDDPFRKYAPLFTQCAGDTDRLASKVRRLRREYRKELVNAGTTGQTH